MIYQLCKRKLYYELFKDCLLSRSRTAVFYNYILRLYLNNVKSDEVTLMGRVMKTRNSDELSFVMSIRKSDYINNNFKVSFSKK